MATEMETLLGLLHEMRDGMRLGFAALQRDLGIVLHKQAEHSSILQEHSAILHAHTAILNTHTSLLAEHSVAIRVLQQDVRELRGEVTRRRPDGE